MNEPLVVVASSLDRGHCLGVAARLSRLGIPALMGPRTDVLGAPRFTVSVPRSAAADAADHISRSFDGAGPYRASGREADEVLPVRRRRLAAFFAVGLAFGLGHVYAREYVAAAILALGQVVCLVLAAQGMGEVLFAFPALVAVDAWGAVRAVDRENQGLRREPVSQLAATLPAVALCLACAAALGPAPAETDRPTAALAR